ncbi:MAG: hypothetical protein RL088_2733 [Verrucomicrobiota bacterium]|jgi:hypothetical protein
MAVIAMLCVRIDFMVLLYVCDLRQPQPPNVHTTKHTIVMAS